MFNLCVIYCDLVVYENFDVFYFQRFVDYLEVNYLLGFDYYELFLFGVGRCMCFGYNLGNILVCLMFGNIIYSYDWFFFEGQSVDIFDMMELFGIIVCRKQLFYLMVKVRDYVVLCQMRFIGVEVIYNDKFEF